MENKKEIQYIPIECYSMNKEYNQLSVKELFKTLYKHKNTILFSSFFVTFIVGYYLFFISKPIYQSQALIEIGHYKTQLLEKSSTLARKLKNIFIEPQKYVNHKQSWIASINSPKNNEIFLEVTAQAYNRNISQHKIQEVVSYVKNNHKKKLTSIKNLLLRRIELIKQEIKKLTNFDLAQIEIIIAKNRNTIKEYKQNLEKLTQKLKTIEKTNSTLALLALLQQQSIQSQIQNLENRIENLTKRKIDIKLQINRLKEKIEDIKDNLSPINYENTHIVGDILSPHIPVKPRKKLILFVTFITMILLISFIILLKNKNSISEE